MPSGKIEINSSKLVTVTMWLSCFGEKKSGAQNVKVMGGKDFEDPGLWF